ncbi:MAG: dihydropteroate synthase [Muribaculaceae bacterium]|nr:dihydropteroate synthase [Muribaculaceae bacterium]
MMESYVKSINIKGALMSLETPKVMGILNATPDSFYSGSRVADRESVARRVRQMVDEGVDIFDVGGYSTRPGCTDISPEEEYSRLSGALEVIRKHAPEIPVSVDTFRADVARRCVEDWQVDIINDIGGGTLDPEMFDTVADLDVAYILMHIKGTPATMGNFTDYEDVVAEVLSDLAFKVAELRRKKVRDVIVDPGFGFAKTVEQNYQLLALLDSFHLTGSPVLAGLSRKTMIWKPLGITAADAANGTTVLNTAALLNGADILRVHDVRNAKEAVKLTELMRNGATDNNRVIRKFANV